MVKVLPYREVSWGSSSLFHVIWDLKADTVHFINVKVSPKKHADICKC